MYDDFAPFDPAWQLVVEVLQCYPIWPFWAYLTFHHIADVHYQVICTRSQERSSHGPRILNKNTALSYSNLTAAERIELFQATAPYHFCRKMKAVLEKTTHRTLFVFRYCRVRDACATLVRSEMAVLANNSDRLVLSTVSGRRGVLLPDRLRALYQQTLNLKYMRAFATAWPDLEIVQRVVAQIPWRSNIALLDKLDDSAVRRWYAHKTIEQGWSQPVLCFHIEARLHERQGKAVTNFGATLPPAESDMAAQIFKDPYLRSWSFSRDMALMEAERSTFRSLTVGNPNSICT